MADLLSANRILVCLRWGIGDTVMELPALQVLRESVPAAHITVLGSTPATELLEGDPRVDAIRTYLSFGITHLGDEASPAERRRLSDWLDTGDFDVVLDPSHAPFAVGRAIRERGGDVLDAFHDLPDPVLARGGSCIEAVNTAIRRGWGIPVPEELGPGIVSTEEAVTWADGFLASSFPVESPIVAVSPVSSSRLKSCTDRMLSDICRHILSSGFRLLVLCGPSGSISFDPENELQRVTRELVVAGPVHLLYTACLLSRCNALVSNDTGLMHIAGAVRTPVIGIFGPTDPSIYLPRVPLSVAVTPKGAACPYRRTHTIGPPSCVVKGRCLVEGGPCIERISLEDVTSAIDGSVGCAEKGSPDETMSASPTRARGVPDHGSRGAA
jgi:ADP-heptose:LPS heptosyltransferase